MTRRLRVPGLLDLVSTDDPATITRLAQDPRLDRDFDGSGPLVNRTIFRRIRRFLWAGDSPIAGVAPCGDANRAKRQQELWQRLAMEAEGGTLAPDYVAGLAKWLAADDETSPGQIVQEAIGRAFRENFVGTSETWRAACLLDAAPRSFNPFRRISWWLAGEPERSRRMLSDSVGDDPAAMHGIAIAVHTLVRSLEAMRELWRTPGCRGLSPKIATIRSLRAPQRVVRRWGARAATLEGDVAPGTMVIFELDNARCRHPGDQFTFMAGIWSACPAGDWATALLRSVWAEASNAHPEVQTDSASKTRKVS